MKNKIVRNFEKKCKYIIFFMTVLFVSTVFTGCTKEIDRNESESVNSENTQINIKDKIQINIKQCMTLIPKGYHGGGELDIEWDFSSLNVSLTESQKQAIENAFIDIEPRGYYANGDKVKISVSMMDDILERENLQLVSEKFSYVVKGLPYEIDLFEKFDLPLSGINGTGIIEEEYLNIVTEEPCLKSVAFNAFPYEALSNGDKVTVTAQYDEELLKQWDLTPVSVSKVYTVTGLGQYPKEIAELEELLEPIAKGARYRLLYNIGTLDGYVDMIPDMKEIALDIQNNTNETDYTEYSFTIRTADLAGQVLAYIEDDMDLFYKSVIVNIYRLDVIDPLYSDGRVFYISMAYEAPPVGEQLSEEREQRRQSKIYYDSYEPSELLEELSYIVADSQDELWETKLMPMFSTDYIFTEKKYDLPSTQESFKQNPLDLNHFQAVPYMGDREGCYYVEGIGYIRDGVIE